MSLPPDGVGNIGAYISFFIDVLGQSQIKKSDNYISEWDLFVIKHVYDGYPLVLCDIITYKNKSEQFLKCLFGYQPKYDSNVKDVHIPQILRWHN